MNLNELKTKALLLKDENARLDEEVKAKKAEYARVICKNFAELILPYMQDMNGFIRDLKPRLVKQEINMINIDGASVTVKMSDCGIEIYSYEREKGFLFITSKEKYKELNIEQWLRMEEFFASTEACNGFIEKLNEYYTKMIESAIRQYEITNPMLTVTLQSLTEKLKNSSCVEQKADGSIEITINGKTYIGTIKEA